MLQKIADVLPLTYFIDLVGDVMLKGAQIWDEPKDVAVILAWGIVGALRRDCATSAGFRARVSFLRSGNPVRRWGRHEPAIAFATRTFEPPALEIRVNFGMFAGREATPAEIDVLATALRDKVTIAERWWRASAWDRRIEPAVP